MVAFRRAASRFGRPRPGDWVLLSYRLPRDPRAPRNTLWRRIKRLGVAQLSDGLVALPADAGTRESLEWLADVQSADGTAGLWVARPATEAQERELATAMAAAPTDYGSSPGLPVRYSRRVR